METPMTHTERLAASCRMALAALLHDLGKFAERRGGCVDRPRCTDRSPIAPDGSLPSDDGVRHMTAYLCTCGTSAAKNLPREARFDAGWVHTQGGIAAAAGHIYQTFRTASLADEQALSRVLSAELHSLARMGVNDRDTVVLFSSETPDGQACAGAVKRYLKAVRSGIDCRRIEVIAGLQVSDADRFCTAGVLDMYENN